MPNIHTAEPQRLRYQIQILEAELHESQRRQQQLIATLDRARAELVASEGGLAIFDGEPIG